jgi:hypothetical protein
MKPEAPTETLPANLHLWCSNHECASCRKHWRANFHATQRMIDARQRKIPALKKSGMQWRSIGIG